MFCHQCGFQINEGEAFCTHCGTKINEEKEFFTQCDAKAKEGEEFCAVSGVKGNEDEKSYAQYYFSGTSESVRKPLEKSKEPPRISPIPSENMPKPPVELQKPSEKLSKLSKKQKSKKILSVNNALMVSTIILVCLSVILGAATYVALKDKDYFEARYNSLSEDYAELKGDKNYYESAYKKLKSDYDDIKESYEFFDEFARIVPDDNSGKYHRYGCVKRNIDASFWIYNVNAAIDYASPCGYCCADD